LAPGETSALANFDESFWLQSDVEDDVDIAVRFDSARTYGDDLLSIAGAVAPDVTIRHVAAMTLGRFGAGKIDALAVANVAFSLAVLDLDILEDAEELFGLALMVRDEDEASEWTVARWKEIAFSAMRELSLAPR
jgi:hypothetical protein